jgi:non-ribosomal peptide synthetase component E (peptide arylation enzyme)
MVYQVSGTRSGSPRLHARVCHDYAFLVTTSYGITISSMEVRLVELKVRL